DGDRLAAAQNRPTDDESSKERPHENTRSTTEERARKMELAAAEERAKEVEEQARLARQVAEAKEEEARVAKEKREAQKERARQKEERKRAEFERKARTRSLAVAAALLVAVIVGVGGLLYSQGEAAARERKIESQVSSALQQALELEGRGRFSEALAAAEGARNVAQEADPQTRERVRTAEARINKKKTDAEAAAKRRANDEKLLAEWRTSLFGRTWGELYAAAVAVFRKYGIDLADPEAAAARIRASDYHAEFASVVDSLSYALRIEHDLEGDWRALVRIAKEADPDPLRNRLRDAGVESDVDALRAIMADGEAQNEPAHTQALLGYALYHCGRYRDAIEVLRRTVRLHPDNDLAHLLLSVVLKTVQPPLTQEAARHAAALVALRPGNDLVGLLAAFFANDFAAALRICDALLAKDPDNVLALRERGSALSDMGDWNGAVTALQEATRLNPGDFLAWQRLFETHLLSGNPLAALAAVRESEKSLAPTPHIRAYQLFSHGLFLAMSGEHEKGIAKAREAVNAAPDFALAHWGLGKVLRRAGRAGPAADALQEAIRLEPIADAHADLGIVLTGDDPVAALFHFRQAVALDPTQADHHVNLAHFHLWHRGDPDSALRAANLALRIDGNNGRAWILLAECHWLKGEMGPYERYSLQIHQLNQRSAAANINLSRIASQQRDYGKALTWARRALAQSDAQPSYHGSVGDCLMHLGRFAEGLAALRTCIEQAPKKGTDDQYRSEFRDRVTDLIDVCERVVPFEARKDAIVQGKLQPQGPAQALAFADLCYLVGAFPQAAAFYQQAAPADRYGSDRAAHAAVQSGPKGRAHALELLRAAYEALKGREDDARVRLVLWDWKRAALLAPVHDPIPLAELPDAERDGWVPFWKDVDALLKRSLEGK
ncbi:MAG: tetratricopeptide repeat protein, partial [Planctomycetota bacterium]